MFPNGTLVISELNEVLDSGQYSCQAKSAASEGSGGSSGSDLFAINHVHITIKSKFSNQSL